MKTGIILEQTGRNGTTKYMKIDISECWFYDTFHQRFTLECLIDTCVERKTVPRCAQSDNARFALNLAVYLFIYLIQVYESSSSLFHKFVIFWSKLTFFNLFAIFLINLSFLFMFFLFILSYYLEDHLNLINPLLFCRKIHQQGSIP